MWVRSEVNKPGGAVTLEELGDVASPFMKSRTLCVSDVLHWGEDNRKIVVALNAKHKDFLAGEEEKAAKRRKENRDAENNFKKTELERHDFLFSL